MIAESSTFIKVNGPEFLISTDPKSIMTTAVIWWRMRDAHEELIPRNPAQLWEFPDEEFEFKNAGEEREQAKEILEKTLPHPCNSRDVNLALRVLSEYLDRLF